MGNLYTFENQFEAPPVEIPPQQTTITLELVSPREHSNESTLPGHTGQAARSVFGEDANRYAGVPVRGKVTRIVSISARMLYYLAQTHASDQIFAIDLFEDKVRIGAIESDSLAGASDSSERNHREFSTLLESEGTAANNIFHHVADLVDADGTVVDTLPFTGGEFVARLRNNGNIANNTVGYAAITVVFDNG